MRQGLVLLGFVLLCLVVGSLAGFATAGPVIDWYPLLQKPSWTPPPWLFAPVWTALYAMMGVAAWLVWRVGKAGPALLMWGVQLALNLGWSVVFFGLRAPGMALLEIALLWLAIAVTIWLFAQKSRVAAWLLVPYLCWVSFAAALNAAIVALN